MRIPRLLSDKDIELLVSKYGRLHYKFLGYVTHDRGNGDVAFVPLVEVSYTTIGELPRMMYGQKQETVGSLILNGINIGNGKPTNCASFELFGNHGFFASDVDSETGIKLWTVKKQNTAIYFEGGHRTVSVPVFDIIMQQPMIEILAQEGEQQVCIAFLEGTDARAVSKLTLAEMQHLSKEEKQRVSKEIMERGSRRIISRLNLKELQCLSKVCRPMNFEFRTGATTKLVANINGEKKTIEVR